MNLVAATIGCGVAAFVATSLMGMIAAQRDGMSVLTQTLAVLVVGATSVALAATFRLLTTDLPPPGKAWCAAALLLGMAWPFWKFVKLIAKSK